MKKKWIALMLTGGLVFSNCTGMLAQDEMQAEESMFMYEEEENTDVLEKIPVEVSTAKPEGISGEWTVQEDINEEDTVSENDVSEDTVLIEEQEEEEGALNISDAGVEAAVQGAAKDSDYLDAESAEEKSPEQNEGDGLSERDPEGIIVEEEWEESGLTLGAEGEEGSVAIDETNFPDDEFRSDIRRIADKDGNYI